MSLIRFDVGVVLPRLLEVSSVVSGRAALSVFECIRFTSAGDRLLLRSSDGEIWMSVSCSGVKFDNDVDFCVDCKNIVSALRSLSGVDVALDIDENKKLLYGSYGKKGRFQLPILSGSDFVDMSFSDDGVTKMVIPSDRFLNGIQSADFAVANDELRPVMNGIRFDFTKDYYECASSDGHKLVYYVDSSVNSDVDDVRGFTLPSKASKVVSHMLCGSDFVKLSFNDERICIDGGDWCLTTRLCVGRYPNYKTVIPNAHPYKAVVKKSDVLGVLNRLIPFGDDRSKLVKIDLNKNELLFSVEDIDWSTSAQEAVECSYDGDYLQIGFKADSLCQTIKNINCDDIIIEFMNASTAAVFRPLVDLADTKYISILMPLIIS